jgi:hypothetical protein
VLSSVVVNDILRDILLGDDIITRYKFGGYLCRLVGRVKSALLYFVN